MPFKPFFNRVLLKPIEPEEKTLGGVWLPDTARDQVANIGFGVVVDVGPGAVDLQGNVRPVCCSIGDRVMFPKQYSGLQIKILGELHYVVRDEEILGKLEPEVPVEVPPAPGGSGDEE